MHRRDFIATGLSSLLISNCSYIQRASAKVARQGCLTAAASGAEWDSELDEMHKLLRSTFAGADNSEIDGNCHQGAIERFNRRSGSIAEI